MQIDAFTLAQRYVGVKEFAGGKDHPLIQWWLSLCGFSLETHDEIAWCSAFVNGIAWELGLPRSRSAAAVSWLTVGEVVPLEQARVGFDVIVLSRGSNPALGHVAFYAGPAHILGGNQANAVCVESFDVATVRGVRRLA